MARKPGKQDTWSDLPLFRHLETGSGRERGEIGPSGAAESVTSPPSAAPSRASGVGSAGSERRTSRTVSPGVRLPGWHDLPPAPPGVRFGTSSWTYPGWFGQVYSRKYRSSGDTVAMLEEYARCPLFNCVGADSTFYRPPGRDTLEAYASVLPEGFQFLGKVYERFTIRRFTSHRKWGADAGRRNPDFLDAARCTDLVVGPWIEALGKKAGPLIFEFQAMYPPDRPGAEAWADLLERFFESLPPGGRYAVELRNPELLERPYFTALARAGVSHVFNAWTRMPPIDEQLRLDGALTAEFTVARALLSRSRTYSDAVDRFKPYDRIREAQPSVRRGIVQLVLEAVGAGRAVYVLVNNRLEGNAPGTIEAIRHLVGQAWRPKGNPVHGVQSG